MCLQVILEHAHGCPLYISEIARSLRRAEKFTETHGGRAFELKSEAASEKITIPLSLHEYVELKMEHLCNLQQFVVKVSSKRAVHVYSHIGQGCFSIGL